MFCSWPGHLQHPQHQSRVEQSTLSHVQGVQIKYNCFVFYEINLFSCAVGGQKTASKTHLAKFNCGHVLMQECSA